MLNFSLGENLYDFVRLFGSVTIDQIKAMFSDAHSYKAMEYQLDTFLKERVFTVNPDTGDICDSRHIPMSKQYRQTLKPAITILSSFGSRNIRCYYLGTYPCAVVFITEDNEVYDITVFNHENCDALLQLIPVVRDSTNMPNLPDTTIHIACVKDTDMIKKIDSKIRFDSYCIAGERGEVNYYEV